MSASLPSVLKVYCIGLESIRIHSTTHLPRYASSQWRFDLSCSKYNGMFLQRNAFVILSCLLVYKMACCLHFPCDFLLTGLPPLSLSLLLPLLLPLPPSPSPSPSPSPYLSLPLPLSSRALMTKLLGPLQVKVEEWKKTTMTLEREHDKGRAHRQRKFAADNIS